MPTQHTDLIWCGPSSVVTPFVKRPFLISALKANGQARHHESLDPSRSFARTPQPSQNRFLPPGVDPSPEDCPIGDTIVGVPATEKHGQAPKNQDTGFASHVRTNGYFLVIVFLLFIFLSTTYYVLALWRSTFFYIGCLLVGLGGISIQYIIPKS